MLSRLLRLNKEGIVVINPLSQINAPITEELRNKMHLKMKEARIKAHNTKLKCFKDLFTKMDKIEESVWLQVSSVQEFMFQVDECENF